MNFTSKPRKAKYDIILAVFFIIIIFSQITFSQTKGQIQSKFKIKAAKALLSNMNSTNRGLAQSAIYMAGYYKYLWTVDDLINILNDSSKEADTRIFAAYSLLMIGDEKGLMAVKVASISGGDLVVQGMCGFMYNKIEDNNDLPVLYQRK